MMRREKGKILTAVAVILCGAMSVTGCANRTESDSSNEEEDTRPKIVVGCDDYTPFSYMDLNGDLVGIDVELAREAFDRMGYQTEFTFINWEEKKKLLKSGEIDCVWSSFSMEGREGEYRWAGPYMRSRQVVAVTPESPIYTLDDLKGKIVAVQSTTKPEEIFRDIEQNDGVPRLRKVISVQKRDLLFTFLSKGYVDAISAHDTSIDQFMTDFDMKYRILAQPLQVVHLGVAFDHDDTRGLDQKLSETLKQMQQDGSVKAIVGKYLQNADSYLGDEDE